MRHHRHQQRRPPRRNGVTAAERPFLDNIGTDIATKQAAYAALAGNLKSVVATFR